MLVIACYACHFILTSRLQCQTRHSDRAGHQGHYSSGLETPLATPTKGWGLAGRNANTGRIAKKNLVHPSPPKQLTKRGTAALLHIQLNMKGAMSSQQHLYDQKRLYYESINTIQIESNYIRLVFGH